MPSPLRNVTGLENIITDNQIKKARFTVFATLKLIKRVILLLNGPKSIVLTLKEKCFVNKVKKKIENCWTPSFSLLPQCSRSNVLSYLVLLNLSDHESKQCYWYLSFNPFPNKPWFLRVCSKSLLKTLWEKEKLLVTSNFSFSHNVFYPFWQRSAIFSKSKIVVCKLLQFGRVQNLSFGKGLTIIG